MSYCVNCGVELDTSLKSCPLCNTPVINPNELKKMTPPSPSPFPTEAGQVETVKNHDLAIFFSIGFLSIAITCGLLNLLVFKQNLWSLAVIGICGILWVFIVPPLIFTKFSAFLAVLLDGIILGLFLYLITYITVSNRWFFGIGLPIVCIVTVIAELIVGLCKRFRISFLGSALYFVVSAALLCVGIEITLDLYIAGHIELVWSAVVLTVCTILSLLLITLLSKKRLRNAVRRRLHF